MTGAYEWIFVDLGTCQAPWPAVSAGGTPHLIGCRSVNDARGLATLTVFHNRRQRGHEHGRPYVVVVRPGLFNFVDVVVPGRD
jgi:hypothetical protein